MSDHPWTSPRLNEDLQFKLVDGPADYADSTDRAVDYVTVASDENGVLGFLWACDADDAADWMDRAAAGHEASNAGTYWIARLREAKAKGLPPSQALAELASVPCGKRVGRVVPGSAATANSVADLKELAAQA